MTIALVLCAEKDVYSVMEMILSSLVLIIDQLPLEMEVIKSLCLVFRSIAMNENNLQIVQQVVASNQFMNVLGVYANLNLHLSSGNMSQKGLGQSLNYDGLSIITEMIGILLTKGNAPQLFGQVSLLSFSLLIVLPIDLILLDHYSYLKCYISPSILLHIVLKWTIPPISSS